MTKESVQTAFFFCSFCFFFSVSFLFSVFGFANKRSNKRTNQLTNTNMWDDINRTINIKNASKRMCNYSSCIFILTQLVGFEQSDNGEKITLPHDVEIDTLIELKNFVEESSKSDNMNVNFNDGSSHEMKMIENNDTVVKKNEVFWACNHCTFRNPMDLNTCQMCGLPGNVCV